MTSNLSKLNTSNEANIAASSAEPKESSSRAQGQPLALIASGRPSNPVGTSPTASSNAFGSTNMATAIEGTMPSQHGRDALGSVNGAVPSLDSPANANTGAPMPTGPASDQLHKPTFTVTPSSFNGGPAGPPHMKANSLQFGDYPAGGPQNAGSSPNLAPAGPGNTRAMTPQQSPSPVPQPGASGGRPPSAFNSQSNAPNFGQLGHEATDANRLMRGVASTPYMPGGPHPPNMRRESSQSSHSDLGNQGTSGTPGRGNYPTQGGRNGRGAYQNQSYNQAMNYSAQPNYHGPANQRPTSNQPRFQGRQPQYPNPPNMNARSPGMMNVGPATPQMPMQVVSGIPSQQYGYPGHGYAQQQGYHVQFHHDSSLQTMYQNQHQQQWLPQNQSNAGFLPPPASPRQNYAQTPHAPFMHQGQHAQHVAPSMSRSSSQISASDRPASSMGQPNTAAVPVNHPHPSRGTGSPAPKSDFIIPVKKSKAIVIKDAQGVVQAVSKQSPSTPSRATPSPVKGATPPASASRSRSVSVVDPARAKADAANETEKRNNMKDAVAKRIAEQEAQAKKATGDDSVNDEPEKTEKEKAKVDAGGEEPLQPREQTETPSPEQTSSKIIEPKVETASEPGAAKAESVEKPATPNAVSEEDAEFEKMIKEMEAEAAAQEKKEAEKEAAYQAKKKSEMETQKQKDAEEEAAYNANLKQAEREAEEAEEARQRKAAGLEAGASSKAAGPAKVEGTATPPSTESPAMQTPVESGAATPVSDVSSSMPPPARSAAPSRKPASLTLETSKQVEPPQPSAAMKALRSARFLEDLAQIVYPTSIASPNPALNKKAPTDRKFKYNKEFLLQFQHVFKEKPAVDWDLRIRDTIGDGGDSSARPGSARTPSTMGARSASNRTNPMQNFPGMGSFGAPPRSGPNAMSADRFPMANAGMPGPRGGPLQNNPFAFGRPPGMPLVGPAMARTGSSTGLSGQHPASPRVGGSQRASNRVGSKRDKKKEQEENRSMPLTSALDLKPIQVSSTGWKARTPGHAGSAGPALDGHMAPDIVQRKVKALLNKMTPEKFEKIADQILEIAAQSKNETDGRTLRQVIQLTFEKATDEAHWASTYAMFCERMLKFMSVDIKDENIKDKHGALVTGGALFRKYLLNRCQEEFERGWKVNMPAKPEGVTEEAALLSEEYYVAAAAKRRGLGLVKFIGELYKLSMLTERIMHECIKKLLEMDENGPDESEVESLVSLLNTVGQNLEQSERSQGWMNAYFDRITQIMNHKDLPSRLKFKLLDVIDLRRRGWQSKNDDKGPKTIAQIHDEAARKQQEAEMERLRQQASNRGGGRLPLGRGDARNFSGGRGAPPPDYNSNNVGTDDLRRLGARTGRNSSNPGGPTLGPSSLFSAGRTNSGRRGLGPGSLLSRGEDSGNSSRTGTPPHREKDKKEEGDKSSTNAFSALAALEGETTNQAVSPPSAASSPPTTKLRPAADQSRARSPEKGKD